MVYYTIYLKNLNNGTGYVDTALADDQLVRDYVQFLEINIRAHRAYDVVDPSSGGRVVGRFAVNLADVSAITITHPGQGSRQSERHGPKDSEEAS